MFCIMATSKFYKFTDSDGKEMVCSADPEITIERAKDFLKAEKIEEISQKEFEDWDRTDTSAGG